MCPGNKPKSPAVVLVSGGMDSAVTLAIARSQGYNCYGLTFDYGQRHRIELAMAATVCRALGATTHRVFRLGLDAFGGSALTDPKWTVPTGGPDGGESIPTTYVPARNTIFLAIALAWAETLGARDLYIGANAVDYSGYPDCRPEYFAAYERLAQLATRAGMEGRPIQIHAPLLRMSKAAIIHRGIELGVDFAVTLSCYQPDADGRACGGCDACRFRRKGFAEAGTPDPTRYAATAANNQPGSA